MNVWTLMRALLIDNYDSFTYNLFQALYRVTGCEPLVLRNDDAGGLSRLDLPAVTGVVVSPGPGSPDRESDFGISRWAVEQDDLPVLGVCLGHQGLCLAAGATVERAPEPMHGRLSAVHHDGTGLFSGIPSPFDAVRYHSLLVYDLPAELEPIATTADGLLMGVRHRERPHWGVQFHPESIATDWGERLLANFTELADAYRATIAPRGARPRRAPSNGRRPLRTPPAAEYRLHVRRLPVPPDPESAFAALFGDDPAAFWLDSSRVIPGLSRFSILGGARGPLAEVVSYRVADGEVRVTSGDGTLRARHRETIFAYLERELDHRRVPDAGLPVDFNLGYVGYLGYELKADCGARDAHRSALPDAALVFSDQALVIDHRDGVAWLLALSTPSCVSAAERWLDRAADRLERAGRLPQPRAAGRGGALPVCVRHPADRYEELIRECLEEIFAGESYEICLTNMISVPVRVDAFESYRILRRRNPAPYAALLKLPGFAVLSSSPERFLRIGADRLVESKPIKGTRPRGGTAEEDAYLAHELVSSEKDRAENLMVVDLVRNDIGRVAQVGSVTVPKLFDVESYQAVHQLVSSVQGRLLPDTSPVRCVQAAFPGGSMTGAPKLRTMEIIDRLESGPRGVYSGALGYLSLNGRADLSIVIRTMVATDDEVTIGTGGAITAQSDPRAEIEETWVKARALLGALAAAVDPAPDGALSGSATARASVRR
jgi:para-aminobenzoate synthetase